MWNTKNWTDNHCQHGVMNSNLTFLVQNVISMYRGGQQRGTAVSVHCSSIREAWSRLCHGFGLFKNKKVLSALSHHGIPSEKHLIGITLVSNDPKHTANEEVSEGWPIRSTLA